MHMGNYTKTLFWAIVGLGLLAFAAFAELAHRLG